MTVTVMNRRIWLGLEPLYGLHEPHLVASTEALTTTKSIDHEK